MVLATPDIESAAARYEVDVVGGVSNVKVITRPSPAGRE